MKKKILTLLLAQLLAITLLAQYLEISPELANRLANKRRFNDIMREVDQYYLSRNFHSNPALYSQYKKWNRWAWYAVRHLNELGEVDLAMDRIYEQSKRMQVDTSGRIESSAGAWNFIGPISTSWALNRGSKGIGRVDRLAFHPTDPLVIFAGTPAGGLWRTNDGGVNWFSISSNIPNCGISGIVVSRMDPTGNTILILTGDGDSGPNGFVSNYLYRRPSMGVLITTDGGNTWNKLGNSQAILGGRRCFKLLQVRNSDMVLLAATDNGVYRTTDGGITWSSLLLTGNFVFDIEQHPTNDAIIYAALQNTVRKSTDGGATFTVTPTFTPAQSSSTRSSIAVTADSPNEVYFLQCGFLPDGTTSYNRLYRSINSGDNYSSINTTDLITGQYGYNCSFAINPTDNNFIIAGGINITSSSDNGANFSNTTTGNISAPPTTGYVHSDIHDLAYNPLNAVNGVVYAATDGGVFISIDNGVNWVDMSNGLSCTQYYHMDGFNGVSNLLIGGTQDNGTAHTTNGANMNYFGAGDGFAVDFVCNDNNTIYYVENTTVNRFNRSTFARVTISPGVPLTGNPPTGDQTFFPNVISHPTNGTIIYVGYANSIWRSSNQGNTWTNIRNSGSSNGGAGHTGGLAVSAHTPNRLYAGNASALWRSDDQGTNWTTISGNPGWPGNFGVITDIAANNANANEVWVTASGNNGDNRVFYSGDAGANWTNYTGSLPNMPVYCIAYSESGDAYIGTELGVYFMDFAMSDWVPYYNGLPMVPVTDLFINETLGSIQASTFGRGIWQSDLYTGCPPSLVLSGVVTGSRTYQSNSFIETTQQIGVSFGNDIRYRAPQRIVLKPGFSARINSTMRAVIGNCGEGIFRSPVAGRDVPMTKHEFLSNLTGQRKLE